MVAVEMTQFTVDDSLLTINSHYLQNNVPPEDVSRLIQHVQLMSNSATVGSSNHHYLQYNSLIQSILRWLR